MSSVIIREIRPEDNAEVAKVIRAVLVELGVPKVGTAYADKALDHMYENYQVARADYFLVIDGDKILGCAGIAQLENYAGNICELQKMYFLSDARGRGLGAQMMQECLDRAMQYGYEKAYIETMPYMKDAQKLYSKFGFEYIDKRLGDTGHYSCPVYMLKNLGNVAKGNQGNLP
ncbi:MAG TPA: GNAT family N-acetyltransferase [Pricia sp.]|uniref:GNAT family N-acetyltransferase n=1 Tax=Pricia antarctica TaxID=641691 RepID=A0A831VWH1_9FLAO|nr:GNAT family N-acetyltransferase [Pricia sp.]HEA22414.1 GNAT family N-acetyltransferase [Pricia antarctica]